MRKPKMRTWIRGGHVRKVRDVRNLRVLDLAVNDDHENILSNTFFEELDNVRDVRVLGLSLCENLKRGHGFGGTCPRCPRFRPGLLTAFVFDLSLHLIAVATLAPKQAGCLFQFHLQKLGHCDTCC